MSAVQNDTLKINHCVNRAAPVSIYRDWPASLGWAGDKPGLGLVQKRGQMSDGGITKFLLDGGTPSPPGKKPWLCITSWWCHWKGYISQNFQEKHINWVRPFNIVTLEGCHPVKYYKLHARPVNYSYFPPCMHCSNSETVTHFEWNLWSTVPFCKLN